MGTLYECLREARLEKYYPTFRANGISRSDALARLSMEECAAMGISSTEDKRRIKELIDIIKSVHGRSSQVTSSRHSRSSGQSTGNTPDQVQLISTPSRSSESSRNRRGLELTRDVTVRDRIPNYSASSYLDMLELLTETSSEESSEDSLSDDEPPVKQIGRTVESSRQARNPTERIKHDSGYNYGVPKSKVTKRHRSSAGRRHREERIKVCVRKRPVTRKEAKAADEDIVVAESTTVLTVNEPKLAVDLKPYLLQHEFLFDEVFDENCSNEDVYVRATRPLISCLFNGGSATCFAYGQTGAGKTHTMMGNKDTPGLYLLAANDIFDIIQSGKHGRGLHVWVSFFEIYCGQLFDLLNKRNRLFAREDGSHRVCIAGLTETEAVDCKVLVEVLEYGNSVRSKGATGVNPDSSRSHAILQMEVRDDTDHRVGRISFIDLAGSERAADVTDTDKQTRLEGAEINQSLLALKECIRSIDQDSRHTPFRQSKLTHILKDSFVGNSKTCMIANISPTQSACENTLNTLRYADRVKELKRESKGTNISQTVNLLMNIPITAPSVFNPSNVQASSTPMKSASSRSAISRNVAIELDPSETPIRGHNVHRKSVKGTPSRHKSSSPVRMSSTRSSSVASRLADIPRKMKDAASRMHVETRHQTSGASSSQQITSQPGASASQGLGQVLSAVKTEASASESDHTDTDSNNMTIPKTNNVLSTNIAVVRSTDTDIDFPTSDFNDIELNDLNKNGESYKVKELQVTEPSSPAAQAWGPAEDGQRKSSYFPEVSNPFRHVPGHLIDINQKLDVIESQKTPDVRPKVDRLFEPGYFSQPFISSLDIAEKSLNPIQSAQNPIKHSARQETTMNVTDRIGDELLFGQLSTSIQQQRHGGVSDDPLAFPQPYVWGSSLEKTDNKTPRNGALNQLSDMPAVLPAHSSDLTIFSQRSPLRTETGPNVKPVLVNSPKSGSQSPKSSTPPLSPTSRPRSPKVRLKKADSLPSSSPVSKSPTLSDDSSEGVRASYSDQGHGSNKMSKSESLRKEKSDPILALHLQQKKQTLPEPAEFLKILSRSSAPRANPSPTPLSISHNSPRRKHSADQLMDLNSNASVQVSSSDPLPTTSGQANPASSQMLSNMKEDDPKADSDRYSQRDVLKPVSHPFITAKDALITDSQVFSPIHPQPLTSKNISQSVSTLTISSDVLQPRPRDTRPWESADSSNNRLDLIDARTKLTNAHEDQLTKVTSICKQEMKLLLTAKKLLSKKGLEDYISKLNDLLNQKMATIHYLQDHINQIIVENPELTK